MNIDKNIVSILKSVFGYENFKNNVQKKAIIAICKGFKNIFISMPPGFGRSLCFQLPVLLYKNKVGIIFSPKLSFIKKEIEFLKSKQINAAFLSKKSKTNERDNILNDLASKCPTISLLYATPEMGTMTYFMQLILSLKERTILSYIVFNEVHCISEWGYEYIPCYAKIIKIHEIYKHIPKILVTTTVTYKVIEDICKLLPLESPKIFRMPVQQINILYDVWFLDIISHPFDHLRKFFVQTFGFLDLSSQEIHKKFGVIYCRDIITAELLKKELNTLGISSLTYHHKLNNSTKYNIENNWISGKVHVIITTYDYGFIHKKSIRCIVYWTVPENISKYYKETAQICSNNSRVYCRIYFSMKEYLAVKFVIENHRLMNNMNHIKKRLLEYEKFVSYCLSVKCRHEIISEYFGYKIPSCKMNCDVCINEEMVTIRTFKFIMYSEKMKGITYGRDINEFVKKKEIELNITEKTEDSLKIQISENSSNNIIVHKNDDILCSEQYKNKLMKDKQKPLFIENILIKEQLEKNYIEINTKNTLKCAKDNSNTIETSKLAIINSLLNKYNSDRKEISLKPYYSQENISKFSKLKEIINIKTYNNQCEQKNENKRTEVLKNKNEIKICERKDHISKQKSCEIIIEKKQSNKRSRDIMHTCLEDYNPKRKKLKLENKSITKTINRDGENVFDSCIERIKDDVNINATCDHATVEYLMNKFQLNRNSITLIPIKKLN
ncbi:ATP-dependent DNA helicase Q5-like isoform X2 [Apis laboriosa]|uniref:ATP-dependent DNA helicase Q5-like isoform X2 n=1 Tax=Apis laboriosa TaxID=183418 RepID=UPI001CC72B62|nr:ATP-dependent DNA helicase Q5-like isoform X2 [Apis laboriosa]